MLLTFFRIVQSNDSVTGLVSNKINAEREPPLEHQYNMGPVGESDASNIQKCVNEFVRVSSFYLQMLHPGQYQHSGVMKTP